MERPYMVSKFSMETCCKIQRASHCTDLLSGVLVLGTSLGQTPTAELRVRHALHGTDALGVVLPPRICFRHSESR